MSYEIERKFLVKGDFRPYVLKSLFITQGYLSSVPERTVRLRIQGDKAFLTIKGVGNATGSTRFEWENEISTKDAHDLLALCEPGVIDKIRHLIPIGEFTFEVDEFLGDNSSLFIAEIELPTEDTLFERPAWLGREVTGDFRYYNAYLTNHPFSHWM